MQIHDKLYQANLSLFTENNYTQVLSDSRL